MREISTWPAASVEMRDISALVPFAKNARTHSAEQVDQIAASMREWGWTNPVLVDEGGMIIAGHGRVMAARQLGLAEAPVMTARGWSEAQKRAYVLADNKLALNAGWDMAKLALELGDLTGMGFDIGLTGFSAEELAALSAMPVGLTDPDEVPETPARAVTQAGDVWLLGAHRLVCGDSTDPAAVGACVGQEKPSLANCDPPYGIRAVKGSSDGGAKPFGKVGGGNAPYGGWKNGDRQQGPARRGRVPGPARNAIIKPGIYDEIIGDDTTDTAIASYKVLTEIGIPVIVMWGGNYYANALPPSQCWLIWDKETNGNFADAELAWTNQKKPAKLFRHQWSGLMKASERGERRVHPTQKPVALAEWVIDMLAPTGDSVFDPFLGSGSTLMACERKQKHCLAIELSPIYVDVSVQRWQNFTGREATLEATGATYAEVMVDRYDANADGRGSYEEWMAHKRGELNAHPPANS